MTIEKSSSNYAILDSGSAITFSNSAELSFSIKMDDTFGFDLVLKFETSDSNDRQIQQSVSGNTITLICSNFDAGLGAGIKSPVELATFAGKKIYFTFWITALGKNASRKVSYTFYSER